MDTCDKCGNPRIIIKRKQSGQMLCQECFIKSIQEKVLKDIRRQKLIEKGDEEAMMPDWEFVEMLEHGMPPTCGFGFGERFFAFYVERWRQCCIASESTG